MDTVHDAPKACCKCGVVFPLSGFYTDKSRKDGLSSRCKECIKARVKEYSATESGKATRNAWLDAGGRDRERETSKKTERKEKRRVYRQRPEVHAKELAYVRAYEASPEGRAKRSAYRGTEGRSASRRRYMDRALSRPDQLEQGLSVADVDRFWSCVTFEPMSGCWLWVGHIDTGGYGTMSIGGRGRRAHRTSWAVHVGPIPRGLLVLHRCDTRPCVNPGHLFLGTHADNSDDMIAKGRARHPRKSHDTATAAMNADQGNEAPGSE